jgi:hypothetical protein
MNQISRCPCCQSGSTAAWPALVAPFIAEFVLRAPVSTCQLLECRSCGFRFFDRRFTDAEAERLYGHYRGPEYFEVRHRHEPWYTARFNEDLSDQSQVLVKRRQRTSDFLERYLDRSAIETVLDYGGESGQAIPDGWGRDRVVYDLSDAAPVATVRKVSMAAELPQRGFDLAMVLHVLEHAAEPATMLGCVRPLLRERGALLVEVPYERFSLRALGRGPASQRYVNWLAAHPLALRVADFYSTAARVKLGLVPPLAVPKLHEHINFFDEGSLAALARASGFEMLGMERPRSDPQVLVAMLRARST